MDENEDSPDFDETFEAVEYPESGELTETDRAGKKTKRVLFIGNSFIHYHKMPEMIRNLAEAAGHKMYWQKQTKGKKL